MALKGVVSKRADRAYAPGDRGLWVKSKCLNREEFVVVGWTDPTGNRPHIGSLLLGYYTDDGRLRYAGRVGMGITVAELHRLAARLAPLKTTRMPLDVAPPRESRIGTPLELSRVHWVKPELVVEVIRRSESIHDTAAMNKPGRKAPSPAKLRKLYALSGNLCCPTQLPEHFCIPVELAMAVSPVRRLLRMGRNP
ncbi:MAG: hypothetical protein AB7F39_03550 [Variibacter sp.]